MVKITAYSDTDYLLMGEGASLLIDKLESLQGLVEWVAGDESLLLRFENKISRQGVLECLEAASEASKHREQRHHEIPVSYDGEDFDEVCELLGLSREEVIRLHTAPVYEVAFMGFSPGFPYLKGLDERLILPRRKTPRTHMKRGAVAIAESYTSIYSVESPGGWNWIGNTDSRLFNPESAAPFLLQPYDTIRFIPQL